MGSLSKLSLLGRFWSKWSHTCERRLMTQAQRRRPRGALIGTAARWRRRNAWSGCGLILGFLSGGHWPRCHQRQ
jgi:hypothetical protein